MPNWVYNELTAQGPKESITKMKEQLNTPFVDYIESNGDLAFGVKEIKYSNPVFSFRNIIAPTDLEAYKAQPARSELAWNDPYRWADIKRISETDNSWYNWNIRNWGVKWDVAVANDDEHPDTHMEETEDEWTASVWYNFNTAWGVADKALTNLSSQYPDLLFTLSYEEETGWGGEAEFLRGTMISDSQYNWKCRDCESTRDEAIYCEECEDEICLDCGYGQLDDHVNHVLESTKIKENA